MNNPSSPRSLSRFARNRTIPVPPVDIHSVPPEHDAIPRLQRFLLHSAILPDDRIISVYLPPAYADNATRRFPVFYLHDGQNLFDPHTSYVPGRTWRAGETADFMAATGKAQSVILVGIASTGLRRMPEYTPTRDFRLGGGEGDFYGRLIIQELKPFIDRTFRTLSGRQHTGLGGSSLGGLISLYLGLQYPGTFGSLGVLSPSIWWDHRSILTFLTRPQPPPVPRIWLDIGTAEGARHVRDTLLLHRMLLERGWTASEDLQLLIADGAVHDEDAWAGRFGQVLAFLFPPPP